MHNLKIMTNNQHTKETGQTTNIQREKKWHDKHICAKQLKALPTQETGKEIQAIGKKAQENVKQNIKLIMTFPQGNNQTHKLAKINKQTKAHKTKW